MPVAGPLPLFFEAPVDLQQEPLAQQLTLCEELHAAVVLILAAAELSAGRSRRLSLGSG